ncbi:hypothetical protein BJV77DRAFT_962859 [Russula vinacea]|nr:hypothetical protein BJV77DRAFT_962859 [Russula vinacea]
MQQRPPPPPEAFPEPFAKSRCANRTPNAAGADYTYLQAGPPPGNIHVPRVPSPSVPPSIQQPRPGAPPPIHRSTYPSHVPAHADPPSYEYASHRPAPKPSSGSVYHPPFPVPVIPPRKSTADFSGPQQSAFQPSKANPSLVHPNTALSDLIMIHAPEHHAITPRAVELSCVWYIMHEQGDFSNTDKRPRQPTRQETAPASVSSELRFTPYATGRQMVLCLFSLGGVLTVPIGGWAPAGRKTISDVSRSCLSPPQRTATVLKMWSRWKRQGKKGLGSAGKEIVLYIYRLALAK